MSYVNQPDGFVKPYHPDQVYSLKKAFYGLNKHQEGGMMNSPTSWYPKGFSKDPQSTSGILYTTMPKYAQGYLKSSMTSCDRIGTPMATKHLDADLSGGDKFVSWSSKKDGLQLHLSSAEAEYVSLSACCAQVLWLRTQLTDYGFHFDKIPMYCDSKAAIAISCNPVQHSRTKHIDVRYHFLKKQVEKGIIELFFVGTEYQLADLFTKALSEDRFKYLVRRLGMRCLTPDELEVLANESA
ncbi:hypothetical protein Tco_1216031 [Tanacetum coccineum]